MKEVYSIFDDAQRSASSRNSCVRKLKSIIESKSNSNSNNNEAIFKTIFLGCFDRVLLSTKTDTKVERLFAFMTECISSLSETFFDISIDHLLERTKANDKTVRYRACQTISTILSIKSTNQSEISEDLCEKLVLDLLPRLDDRYANARVQAVYALRNLQSPTTDDPVTHMFTRLISSDSSHEVRSATIECIIINSITLPVLVSRVKDTHRLVRISAFNRLAENVDIRHLTMKMRGIIVRHGLNDRELLVKQAAVDLIFTWLRTFDYKVPQMLKYIGINQNEKEIEELSMHILEHIDTRGSIPTDMKAKVKNQAIVWGDHDLDTIPPSELVWTKLRCMYSYRYMTPSKAADCVSDLTPDIVEVCRLLESVPVTVLSANNQVLSSFRCILQMAPFFDPSDTIGNKQLSEVCERLMLDTAVPGFMLEPLLNTWKLAWENLGAYDPCAVTQLIEQTREKMRAIDSGDSQESLTDEDYVMLDALRARTLLIYTWSLQGNIGTTIPDITSPDGNSQDDAQSPATLLKLYESYIPYVLESIQCPNPHVRGLAVACLGLLPLYSEAMADQYHILYQAASAELEDEFIRCQALQSVLDIATVYGDKFKEDTTLSNLLYRLFNHATGQLRRIAVEGTAKLLFSGCLVDSRLFANLIKFFFLPELSSDATPATEEVDQSSPADSTTAANGADEANPIQVVSSTIGSQARLHQALSLFFHFFLMDGSASGAGEGAEGGKAAILLDSISELVSDVSSLIRDEAIEINSLSNVRFSVYIH